MMRPALAVAASCAALSVVCAAEALASGDQPTIGMVALDLGMSQAVAVEKLTESYALMEITETPGLYIVLKKGGGLDSLGSVTFKEERLASVSRGWGLFSGEEALKLGRELHSLLANLEAQGGAAECVVDTEAARTPGLRVEHVTLRCGGRSVTFIVTEDDEMGAFVGLSESWDVE